MSKVILSLSIELLVLVMVLFSSFRISRVFFLPPKFAVLQFSVIIEKIFFFVNIYEKSKSYDFTGHLVILLSEVPMGLFLWYVTSAVSCSCWFFSSHIGYIWMNAGCVCVWKTIFRNNLGTRIILSTSREDFCLLLPNAWGH